MLQCVESDGSMKSIGYSLYVSIYKTSCTSTFGTTFRTITRAKARTFNVDVLDIGHFTVIDMDNHEKSEILFLLFLFIYFFLCTVWPNSFLTSLK